MEILDAVLETQHLTARRILAWSIVPQQKVGDSEPCKSPGGKIPCGLGLMHPVLQFSVLPKVPKTLC